MSYLFPFFINFLFNFLLACLKVPAWYEQISDSDDAPQKYRFSEEGPPPAVISKDYDGHSEGSLSQSNADLLT